MTAHDLAKRLLGVPDLEVQLMRPGPAGNTVYALRSQDPGPSVSASGLVWLGIERLYGPEPGNPALDAKLQQGDHETKQR